MCDLSQLGLRSYKRSHFIPQFFSHSFLDLFSNALIFFVLASNMTFPLAMKVATFKKPRDSKDWRKVFILMGRPPPTLIARSTATYCDIIQKVFRGPSSVEVNNTNYGPGSEAAASVLIELTRLIFTITLPVEDTHRKDLQSSMPLLYVLFTPIESKSTWLAPLTRLTETT